MNWYKLLLVMDKIAQIKPYRLQPNPYREEERRKAVKREEERRKWYSIQPPEVKPLEVKPNLPEVKPNLLLPENDNSWNNFRHLKNGPRERRTPEREGKGGSKPGQERAKRPASAWNVFETYVLPHVPEIRSKPPAFVRHLLTPAGNCPKMLIGFKQKILQQISQIQQIITSGDAQTSEQIGQQCATNVKQFINSLSLKTPNHLWDKFVVPTLGKISAQEWAKISQIPNIKAAWDNVVNIAKNDITNFDAIQAAAHQFVALAQPQIKDKTKPTKRSIFFNFVQPNLQDVYPPSIAGVQRFSSDMIPQPQYSPQLNTKKKILRDYWNEAVENPPYGTKDQPSWYLQRLIQNVREMYQQNNRLHVPLGPRAYPNDPNKLNRQNIANNLVDLIKH